MSLLFGLLVCLFCACLSVVGGCKQMPHTLQPCFSTGCNYCAGSAYANEPVVVSGCLDKPKDMVTAICLSFFFGMYVAFVELCEDALCIFDNAVVMP